MTYVFAEQEYRGSVLTAEDARVIYGVRLQGKRQGDASRLGTQFGITAKAVRDIWTHRTWIYATVSLWPLPEAESYVVDHLCEKCCSSGVRLELAAAACTRCMRMIRAIVAQRKDIGGSEASAGAAIVREATVAGTRQHVLGHKPEPYVSLRRQTMSQIWRKCDSDRQGLLGDALDLVCGSH